MKAGELRSKSVQDLKGQLLDLHREQFNLRMQKATGQLSKSDRMKMIRRDIARVHTILTEKGSPV